VTQRGKAKIKSFYNNPKNYVLPAGLIKLIFIQSFKISLNSYKPEYSIDG